MSCSLHDRAQDKVVMGLYRLGPARCAAVIGWTPSGHVARLAEPRRFPQSLVDSIT